MEAWREWLARIPGVTWFLRALKKSNQDQAKDMAASIAYFTFFSLFPLLVGVVAGASLFVERQEIGPRLDRMLADEFPGSADFLRTNLQALIKLRGAAGIASVVGLLWAASKMFGALSRGINQALGIAQSRRFVLSRLRHFAMAIGASLLLLLAVGGSMALDIGAQLSPARLGLDDTVLAPLSGHIASFAFISSALLLLYTVIPDERPGWRSLIPGTLAAAFLFELGKALFVVYLDKARDLQAVYGSLTSVIVLLLWLYFSARVLLFGAELIAVREQPETMPPPRS